MRTELDLDEIGPVCRSGLEEDSSTSEITPATSPSFSSISRCALRPWGAAMLQETQMQRRHTQVHWHLQVGRVPGWPGSAPALCCSCHPGATEPPGSTCRSFCPTASPTQIWAPTRRLCGLLGGEPICPAKLSTRPPPTAACILAAARAVWRNLLPCPGKQPTAALARAEQQLA